MNKENRAWVFVSHSTKDVEKVRAIRNALENSGAEPILFFLKCIRDTDELDDLLKREIAARNFFLLCDSQHAKTSKWVQEEMAHVNSLEGKKIEIIDLDGDWRSQLAGIQKLVREARIFLSFHAGYDGDLVNQVSERLTQEDFAVLKPEEFLQAGDDVGDKLRRVITETLDAGYFVHFISSASLASQWVRLECELALEIDPSRYLPVLLEPIEEIADLLPELISQHQMIDGRTRDPDLISREIANTIFAKK